MIVLVDTSVWADFFNGQPSTEAAALERLIENEEEIVTCGVVLAEFFQGLRNRKDIPKLESYFREMRLLSPREPDTYFDAARLFRDLRRRGVTVRSTIDCLVARLAEEAGCLLLSRDRDMKAIISSGLVNLDSATIAAWCGL